MPIVDVKEIQTYIDQNKDNAEVKGFLGKLKTPTVDDFKTAAETNEDVKKIIQSIADQRVTGAIKTYEEKSLPEKIKAAEEALRKTLAPEETADQKKLRELEDKIKVSEGKVNQAALRTLTLTKLSAEGLTADLADLVMGADEASTTERITKVKGLIASQVEKQVAALLGGAPPPVKKTGGKADVDLDKMTMDEYAAWYKTRSK